MENWEKRYYIITGGTMVHVAPHFSFCAPAYGAVGKRIQLSMEARFPSRDDPQVCLIRTQMARGGDKLTAIEREVFEAAGLSRLETNDDLSLLVDSLLAEEETCCIIFAAAVCDWEPTDITQMSNAYGDAVCEFGKDTKRLRTRAAFPGASPDLCIGAKPSDKIIKKIRERRKDVFLVGFKATAGETKEETYRQGLRLLKQNSCNLVFANDVHNHHNMVITPEEFPYHASDRKKAIKLLSELVAARTKLDFVRTLMIDDAVADPIKLHEDGSIPQNFVPVLKHLIENNAYKPFLGKTSGHFGCKVLKPQLIYRRISSVRKVDHNKVFEQGMARIFDRQSGDDVIRAGGTGKPSVGEHTQSMIYEKLGDAVHSIVHFHCPLRERETEEWKVEVRTAPQKEFECGSVQCGLNTAHHLRMIDDGVWAVHLEGHGPNIAFHKDVPAEKVIELINYYWDLSDKTGGLIG